MRKIEVILPSRSLQRRQVMAEGHESVGFGGVHSAQPRLQDAFLEEAFLNLDLLGKEMPTRQGDVGPERQWRGLLL